MQKLNVWHSGVVLFEKNCISLHQFYYYYLTLLFDLCLDLKRRAESLTLP